MVIEKNTVVAISYSIHDESSKLLEDNDGYAPIVYLQGAGNIISELEIGLEGLKAGDTKEIVVASSPETNPVLAGEESSRSGEDKVKSLRFNIKIIYVRDATLSEINAGFPLQEGSCDGKPGCC